MGGGRIGIELSIATLLLRPALNAISRHCDDVDLSLPQDGQAEICAAMLAGEIDVAVLVEAETLSERLDRWPLFSEGYVIAFPGDHPFGMRPSVNVRELETECMLMVQRADCRPGARSRSSSRTTCGPGASIWPATRNR